jgi:hypothetical protein
MAGIGYSSGYSPYTGAGNLALAMGANPSFGGATGGYQEGGYTPSNVGGVNYSSSAPSGYAWGASGLVPIGTGQAGIQAYNPAIATSPTRSFQAPSFTNSMSDWNPYGTAGSSALMNATDYYGEDTGGGSSSPYPGYSQNSQGVWVADPPGGGASSFDQNSMMNSGQGGGRYGSMGTALANLSAFPNPGVTMPSYSTADIMNGIYGGEAPGGANPYQMLGGPHNAMAQLQQWGYNVPTNAFGVPQSPTNPAASEQYASEFIGHLQGQYPYAEQVATAFGPSGANNVNMNYQGPGSGTNPYLRNVSQNQAGNQTPQAYLYGNPSTGYPGVMTGMNNSALTNQFNQAAGAGQTSGAPSYMNAPAQGGRY